jgi:hypothetical protein
VCEKFPITTYSSVHDEIMTAFYFGNAYLYTTDNKINLFPNPVNLTHNQYDFYNKRFNSLVIYPKCGRDGTNETYKSPALTHTNATVPISTPSRRLKCPINKTSASQHTTDSFSAFYASTTYAKYFIHLLAEINTGGCHYFTSPVRPTYTNTLYFPEYKNPPFTILNFQENTCRELNFVHRCNVTPQVSDDELGDKKSHSHSGTYSNMHKHENTSTRWLCLTNDLNF